MTKRPKSMRTTLRDLFYAARGICAYCQRATQFPGMLTHKHELSASVDHKIPISRGGKHKEADNLVLACTACNNIKANMMPDEWAAFMEANPEWWRKRRFKRVPIEASMRILREGRVLRRPTAVPKAYEEPAAQAAFEAVYRDKLHLLREW